MIGQMIGQGNTAEVYLWGDKEILKLFRQTFPCEGIEREYNVSKEVEKLGLPIPKVGQMIELEGRKGITYEKMTGTSMLDQIMKHPTAVKEYGKQLAEMHYQIHQCKVVELPKYKEALEWNIRHTDLLTETQRFVLLDILEQLPEEGILCHGDFHPGNIMTASDKSVTLDWMTATIGSPAADVSRTMFLLKDAALPGTIPGYLRVIINLVRRHLAESYFIQYQKLSGISKEDIMKWRLPIIAARLVEWIPENEKGNLLKEIKKSIGD